MAAVLAAGCISGITGSGDYQGTWLIKCDASGHVLFIKFFSNDYPDILAGTNDGGMFVSGYTPYSWLAKLDEKGELQWELRYNESLRYRAIGAAPVQGGNYIATDGKGTWAWISSDSGLIRYQIDTANKGLSDVLSLSSNDKYVVAVDYGSVTWMDDNGITIDRAILRYGINPRPLVHVIDGGDCVLAYSSGLNEWETMYIARLNRTGYVWNMSMEGKAPVFIYESPGERLCLVYGDAGAVNGNNVTLDIMMLSYDGIIESVDKTSVKSAYAPSGDGGFVYAGFASGTVVESVARQGAQEKVPDVYVVKLDSDGGERWRTTVDLGKAWYTDNPGTIIRTVKSVTPTGDDGYVVLVESSKKI